MDESLTERMDRLGAAEGVAPSSGWTTPDAFWPFLERMRLEGAVVVIKLDGLRTGEEDGGAYTVVLSGGALGNDFVRHDADSVAEALGEAVLAYARGGWGAP